MGSSEVNHEILESHENPDWPRLFKNTNRPERLSCLSWSKKPIISPQIVAMFGIAVFMLVLSGKSRPHDLERAISLLRRRG